MNKREKQEAVKKKKRINELIKEFIKRSEELEKQENKFRNKVLIDYNK